MTGDRRYPATITREIRADLYNEHLKKQDMNNSLKYLHKAVIALPEEDRPKVYAGLKAELEFFVKKGKEMNLEPALDYGNHVDFSGIYEGIGTRIDVTTNPKFKRLENYVPFVDKGEVRHIALKLQNGEFKMISMNFPICLECEKEGNNGRLFDVILLSEIGGATNVPFEGSTTQYLAQVCSHDPDSHKRILRGYNALNPAPGYIHENLKGYLGDSYDSFTSEEIQSMELKELNSMVDGYVRFFKKGLDFNPVILAEDEHYFITNPTDGDGFFGTQVWWIEKIVENSIGSGDLLNTHFE